MIHETLEKNQNEEISLREVVLKVRSSWNYLFSKWILIILFGATGVVIGFTYANYKKTLYTATTTFVLEDEKSGGGGLSSIAGLATMAGVDIGGSGGGIFQGDNILELYKSRTMIEKTLLGNANMPKMLIERYIDVKGIKIHANEINKDITKEYTFSKLNDKRTKDSIIGIVVDNISKNNLTVVKPDKKLSIIKVDLKFEDEAFAKAFDDELVKNVNEFYIQTKTKKSQDNINILQHKTDSVRRIMNGAIYSAVSVTDATPNLNPTKLIQRDAPVQKAQFSLETNKAILAELVKNLELSKMNLLKETPLIQVVDKPIFPLEKKTFGKIKFSILGGVFGILLICMCLLFMRGLRAYF